jgi:hypothetical protein
LFGIKKTKKNEEIQENDETKQKNEENYLRSFKTTTF